MITKILKNNREKIDINQTEMGKIFDVTYSTISSWETGKSYIPLKKLIQYANHFKYSLDYIFDIDRENTVYNPLTINLKIVGRNLRELRKKNHMTQYEVAKKLNTTQSTISAYEAGIKLINIAFLLNLIKIYKPFSIDELFGRVKK